MDTNARPGFKLDCTFRAHLSTVRLVRFNKLGFFISCDDKSFKAWTADQHGQATLLHDCNFPGYQSTFITALTITHEPLNLAFAACLDGNLRLYSEKLRLRSCMPWSNGAVRDMAFNTKRAELITAGSYGVKAWTCELDHEAYRNDKNVDPFAIPRSKDGQIIPWGFGKYQHARQRLQFMVPGARAISSHHKGGSHSVDSPHWCERILLHEATQTLFAMFQGSIYGFDAETGACKMAFQDLHTMPITSMVYAPSSDTLMTVTLEEGVTVWRIAGGKPHRFRSFGKAVSYLVPDDVCKPTCLLTSSVDGVVTLWGLDSAQPVYRMKLAAPLAGPPAFYGKNKIVAHYSNEHIAELWAECNSAPVRLSSLPGSGGLVLAEYADSSVRLLDATSTEADKSCVTIPPQLSSSTLLGAAVSLTRARLYALLSGGEVHVWQLARGRPPTFSCAWSHLAREHCSAITLVEAGSLQSPRKLKAGLQHVAPPGSGIFSALHLTLSNKTDEVCEHLVLGTSSGDVVVVDADHGGCVTARFPAFKQQPVSRVLLCAEGDRPLLLSVARCCLKIWSLDEQPRCLHVLDTSQQIRVLELLGVQAIIGTTSGSVHMVNIHTGQATAAASSLDHMDCVQGCSPSNHLNHFVTCGRDSQIKVFDSRKVLKRSIHLATAPSAICYLNDLGDLLVAVQRKLLLVRASTYEKMVAEEDLLAREVLYPTATPTLRATRPVHSSLLSPAQGPPAGALLPALSFRSSQPSPAAAAAAAANGPVAKAAVAVVPLLPGLPKSPAQGGTAQSHDDQGVTASLVHDTGSQGTAQLTHTSAGTPGGSAVGSSRGSTSNTGQGQHDVLGSDCVQGVAEPTLDSDVHRTYHVTVGGTSTSGQVMSGSQGPGSQGVMDNTSIEGQPENLGSDGNSHDRGSRRSGSAGSDSETGTSDSGGSDDSDWSGSGSESESESDEETRQAREEAVARRKAEEYEKLRQKQIAYLMENYKLMNLPFQTLFKVDLSSEALKQQRKRFGLDTGQDGPQSSVGAATPAADAVSDDPSSPHSPRSPRSPASPSGGALPPDLATTPGSVQGSMWGVGAAPEGDLEQVAADIDWDAAAAGLTARFKKLLPLLAHPNALLEDGTLPPELQDLLAPVTYPTTGKARKKRRHKKRKDGRTAAPGGASGPALRSTAVEAAKGSSVIALSSTTCQAQKLIDKLLAKNLPPGASAVVGEEKKKDRRKKKKRKGKKGSSALAVLDPAAHLARVARNNHHVMLELQSYNKHRMLTRPAGEEHTLGSRQVGKLKVGTQAAAGATAAGARATPALAATRDAVSFRTMLQAVSKRRGDQSAEGGKSNAHAATGEDRLALELLNHIL